jgi:hypothetical protein
MRSSSGAIRAMGDVLRPQGKSSGSYECGETPTGAAFFTAFGSRRLRESFAGGSLVFASDVPNRPSSSKI